MTVNGKEYITIKEMAERLGKKPNAVKQLLYNAGIKPVSRDALYEMEAFEAIKDAPPPGRPKHPVIAEALATVAELAELIKSGDMDAIQETLKRHNDFLFKALQSSSGIPIAEMKVLKKELKKAKASITPPGKGRPRKQEPDAEK